MSTLLERMIQRTRAPLSSLEPLSQPQFAPARPAQRPGADSASEIAETAPDESGAAGQYPRPGAHPELPREELTRIHRADGPANSAAAQRPGEAEPLAAPPPPALGLEPRSAATSHRSPDTGQTHPEPATASYRSPDTGQTHPEPATASYRSPDTGQTHPEPATASYRSPDTGQTHPEPATASYRSPDTGQTHPEPATASYRSPDTGQTHPEPAGGHRSPEAGQTQPEPAAMPARRAGGNASRDALGPGIEEPASPAAGEPGAAPEVRPVTVPARMLSAAPRAHAHEGSGRSPVPRESAADTSGGRPDVTISIGHIEVRAAPPMERPRTRPPFRPRVSLDDFLYQQEDRRR